MRIGIEADKLEGGRTGVGRVLISILQEWDKFDLPADLKFILYFKNEIPDDLELSKSNFEYKLLKAPFNIKSRALFRHYSVSHQAKQDQLDILFCPDYVAPIFYFGKIALILHDISYQVRPDIYNWPSLWDRILLKWFSKISAKRAEWIFAVSNYTKQEILKHYRIDEKKVFVFYNAVNEKFKIIEDEQVLEDFKKRYRIKDKLICSVGSIVNRRHLDKVIEAFVKIGKRMPNYQFLISGRNHTSPFIDIDKLIRQVNQELNREAIIRIDFTDDKDLPLLYNAADLLIWLSEYEGFGLPILEAMACGAVVVASRTTCLPEIAGSAAIYVERIKDVDEIERAIYQGLTDMELREDLISQGLQRKNLFSWRKTARRILDVLTG